MPYLTQLAAVARRTGHPVTEVSGWKTRGHGPQPEVKGIVCHHTAGPKTGDYPSLGVVRSGRPGLDGPLSHFGIGRSGRIYVIAAGRCWHNAPSTSALHDNSSSIGIEAENTGTGQAWPAVQLDAYRKLCAELCKEFKLPASRVKGHREVNVNKIDPKGIDMNTFRAAVARLIAGEGDDDMEPSTKFKISPYWQDRGEFSHETYDAGFLWTGAVSETRTYGKKILAQLQAQNETIKQLTAAVTALSTGNQVDPDELVRRIEAAIEGVTIRLDVADDTV